ncbi:TPA: hypothetical protein ACQ0F8_001623 [Streptococcus agalactiae]|nr:hypothetical protein [Streptococcus agalactiae]HEO4177355.1 hypothetical protein [Streptococcus agalactiae]
MEKTIKRFVEKKLSPLGILELDEIEQEKEGSWDWNETVLYFSLFLDGFSEAKEGELGYVEIIVYYNNHKGITYELGKSCFPLFTNSKDNQKRLLEIIMETDLNFCVEFEKIKKNTNMYWDRYSTSVTGVETTKIEEFIVIIEKFKSCLMQVKREDLEALPEGFQDEVRNIAKMKGNIVWNL